MDAVQRRISFLGVGAACAAACTPAARKLSTPTQRKKCGTFVIGLSAARHQPRSTTSAAERGPCLLEGRVIVDALPENETAKKDAGGGEGERVGLGQGAS